SADWCWEAQDELEDGHFIPGLIFGSDETSYSQLGGDKKGWPIFMSIINIHSSVRNLKSSKTFV
ncbi:hypothetical protein BJ508DRAFT_218312, partial [Ascobolus immersus RN42]